MNTVALFQCADQILTGLKKTLKTNRVLAPIDVNVQGSSETGRDLFHTPAHHMRIARPSSDQPRRHMSSLHNDRLNNSADVLPSGVSLTTSGLTISEIVREVDVYVMTSMSTQHTSLPFHNIFHLWGNPWTKTRWPCVICNITIT